MDGSDLELHNSNIMRQPTRAATPALLPTYSLYGEPDADEGFDWLHCESIAERSVLHEWEIRPHRHAALLQILYLRQGRGEALAEGLAQSMRGPCVVVVPPLSVHGFRFTPGVEGLVVTAAEAHVRSVLGQDAALVAQAFAARVAPLRDEGARALRQACATLQDEFHGLRRWRARTLDAALLQLLVAVARLPRADAARDGATGGRALAHVERYRGLVERRYREQPSVAACAQALAITPTQLNRVCRRVLGRGALEVLHARLVLEAQRELAYTAMSIKQIGIGLGFADAAYFTRFFQRSTGRTPSAWRQRR